MQANHSGIGWARWSRRRLGSTGDATRSDAHPSRPMKLAILGSAAVAALLSLPGLLIGPSFDAAVFTEVAARVSDGVVPYAGVWDHKPPGIYLLGALAQLVTPFLGPWPVMWALCLAFVIGSAVLVSLALQRLGFRRGAAFGGIIAAGVPTVLVISLGGGLTEPLSALPLAMALLVVVEGGAPDRWRARSLLLGALLGVALLFSLMAAPGVLALAVVALAGSRTGTRVWSAALIAAGVLVPWAAVLLPIAVVGGAPAAVDALVTYGGVYRAVNLGHVRAYPHAEASVAVLALMAIAIPAGVGAARTARLPAPWPALTAAGLIWVLGTAGIAIYLGRFETHYAAPLGIPLALFATIGLGDVARRARRSPAVAMTMIPALAIGAVISLVVVAANSWALIGPLQAEAMRTESVGAYLREHSSPESPIFVWGNEPQLYYLSDRAPASRFIYLLPLTTPGYVTPAMIEGVVSELAASAPTLVVDAGSLEPGVVGDPPLLIPRPVANEDGRAYDILDPVRAYITAHYSLLEIVNGWPVYQRRAAG